MERLESDGEARQTGRGERERRMHPSTFDVIRSPHAPEKM